MLSSKVTLTGPVGGSCDQPEPGPMQRCYRRDEGSNRHCRRLTGQLRHYRQWGAAVPRQWERASAFGALPCSRVELHRRSAGGDGAVAGGNRRRGTELNTWNTDGGSEIILVQHTSDPTIRCVEQEADASENYRLEVHPSSCGIPARRPSCLPPGATQHTTTTN